MPSFDDAARQRIEAAIADAEARSTGELVVTSVPASDNYLDLRLLYAGALALSLTTCAHLLWPAWPVSWLLWLEMGLAALCVFVLGTGPLIRLLVPHVRIEHSLHRRAREAFLEHELFATRDRSGVLILISLLEHRVVILGDAGIHARIGEGAWQAHVDHLVKGFRGGNPTEAVCTVVSRLGDVLAEHFPPRADDTNELPNTVRVEPAKA